MGEVHGRGGEGGESYDASCCHEHGVTTPLDCSCKRLLVHPDIAALDSSSSPWQQERQREKGAVMPPDIKHDISSRPDENGRWFIPIPSSKKQRGQPQHSCTEAMFHTSKFSSAAPSKAMNRGRR